VLLVARFGFDAGPHAPGRGIAGRIFLRPHGADLKFQFGYAFEQRVDVGGDLSPNNVR